MKAKKAKTKVSKKSLENMKYEIAQELGVNMGPDASSRTNGKVGGEMTRRLVNMGSSKTSRKKKSK